MALSFENSPAQVVPSWVTSGVCLPATAVISLSCATFHGIAVTLTLMSGLACWNCWMTSLLPSLSPSSPIAQTDRVTVPELEVDEVPPVDVPELFEHATEQTSAATAAARADTEIRIKQPPRQPSATVAADPSPP